ncbi:MAG: hypothetical protein P0Y49_02650 [Candidatus Pedobacter colombiensis]|uniref:Uncharacterized protein n=1 Tax=Candidatus Pedobacter colombiensis TaxID=3121371 RepID=A0AAJ5WC88_9SPHI|nr:hypothetical protein [Pedobacter sp.]WEK20052.1 MAG: hypothetical protein P0Y49_02650 [Pedobacter sp.]
MMNQEDIFKKVGHILNELQDQYEFLAQNPSQLNELELELFLANANFLSDHVQIVRKINSNKAIKAIPERAEDQTPVIPEVVTISEVITKEPEIIQVPEIAKEKTLEELEAEYVEANEEVEEAREPLKFEFLLNDEPLTDKFEFEEQPVSTIFDRPLSKQEEEIIAEKQRLRDSQLQQQSTEKVAPEEEKSIPVQEPIVEKVEEKIIVQPVAIPVIDKAEEAPQVVKEPEVNQPRPTLNDMLGGKGAFSASLNEESNKTGITDLKQAINLNQKLLYIKDLFNGYNLAYAEAIDVINKMPDFKTVDSFLQQNYAVKNNWASKQATVDQFYELLNQRFPAK